MRVVVGVAEHLGRPFARRIGRERAIRGVRLHEGWSAGTGRPVLMMRASCPYQGQSTTSTVRVTGVALLPPLSVSV